MSLKDVDIGTHNYVATAKCGCVVAVVADMPGWEKDTARSLADFIKRGYSVNRMTHEEYTRNPAYGHTAECKARSSGGTK